MNSRVSHAALPPTLPPLWLLPLALPGSENWEASPPDCTVTVRKTGDPERDEDLQQRLLEQASCLSVTGYEQLVARLLHGAGYSEVIPLRDPSRPRRSHKGRNRHGGVDITARKPGELSCELVVVQVKQYRRPVSRRFVDELRGALLRLEARQALLITTSAFSPAAREAAREDHIAPVRLIDGAELGHLLARHRLGLRRDGKGRWRVDRSFFRRLDKGTASHSQPLPDEHSDLIHRKPRAATDADRGADRRRSAQKGGNLMGRTHAMTGIAALWLLEPTGAITQDSLVILVLAAVFGALLPDLDATESLLKRLSIGGITPFVPVSHALHQTFGHRGMLHSAVGLALVTAVIAVPLGIGLGWPAGTALSLGYASHLFADSATKSGIPLLYPRRVRFHLLPPGWRVTTGSQAEEALFPLLALAVLLLLFRHFSLISQ